MQLLITNCTDGMRWYSDLVGEKIPFLCDLTDEYKSRERDGYVNFVQYNDAVVINDDGDIVIDKRMNKTHIMSELS